MVFYQLVKYQCQDLADKLALMELNEAALQKVGFLLMHACFSIYDLPETLIPLAAYRAFGEDVMARGEGEVSQESIQRLKQILSEVPGVDYYGVVYEAATWEPANESERVHVLIVEMQMNESTELRLIQPFEPCPSRTNDSNPNARFRLVAPFELFLNGECITDEPTYDNICDAVLVGVGNHGSHQLWDEWCIQ